MLSFSHSEVVKNKLIRIRLVQEKYNLYTALGQTCENAFISFNHTREGNQYLVLRGYLNIAKLFSDWRRGRGVRRVCYKMSFAKLIMQKSF